jgi:CMP-N-acetylneuraminic acid synthetase
MTSLVALLPMKAHSERVPGKNFRLFNGKPLFRWMLDTLTGLEEVERIVINTDARAMLAEHGVTESPRVTIRDRREELCGDFVSMNRILEDDLAAFPADGYLMTHATNPLLKAATLRAAIDRYRELRASDESDSLFAVTAHQSRFYRRDGTPVNHDPANLARTQDLEPLLEENSCVYLFSRQSFAATGARIGARPAMFATPLLESIDIDDADGFRLAELIVAATAER